jgi:hypothetical protein
MPNSQYLRLLQENEMFGDKKPLDTRWDSFPELAKIIKQYGFVDSSSEEDDNGPNSFVISVNLKNEDYSVGVSLENDGMDKTLSVAEYESGNFSGNRGSTEGLTSKNEKEIVTRLLELIKRRGFKPVTTPTVENALQESKKVDQDWGDTYQKLVNDQLKKNSEPLTKIMNGDKKGSKKKETKSDNPNKPNNPPYSVGNGWFSVAGNTLDSNSWIDAVNTSTSSDGDE